jgi:hypothetical protein
MRHSDTTEVGYRLVRIRIDVQEILPRGILLP